MYILVPPHPQKKEDGSIHNSVPKAESLSCSIPCGTGTDGQWGARAARLTKYPASHSRIVLLIIICRRRRRLLIVVARRRAKQPAELHSSRRSLFYKPLSPEWPLFIRLVPDHRRESFPGQDDASRVEKCQRLDDLMHNAKCSRAFQCRRPDPAPNRWLYETGAAIVASHAHSVTNSQSLHPVGGNCYSSHLLLLYR